jgi:hypothetical protein
MVTGHGSNTIGGCTLFRPYTTSIRAIKEKGKSQTALSPRVLWTWLLCGNYLQSLIPSTEAFHPIIFTIGLFPVRGKQSCIIATSDVGPHPKMLYRVAAIHRSLTDERS